MENKANQLPLLNKLPPKQKWSLSYALKQLLVIRLNLVKLILFNFHGLFEVVQKIHFGILEMLLPYDEKVPKRPKHLFLRVTENHEIDHFE